MGRRRCASLFFPWRLIEDDRRLKICLLTRRLNSLGGMDTPLLSKPVYALKLFISRLRSTSLLKTNVLIPRKPSRYLCCSTELNYFTSRNSTRFFYEWKTLRFICTQF